MSFDDINLNENGLDTNPCHVGMKFRPGFVGVLSQVKYFLDQSKPTYVNNLVF